MGVDVPNQSVCRHLYGFPLNHHLLHAARVVHLVPTDAELARPRERKQTKCAFAFLYDFEPTLDGRQGRVGCLCLLS